MKTLTRITALALSLAIFMAFPITASAENIVYEPDIPTMSIMPRVWAGATLFSVSFNNLRWGDFVSTRNDPARQIPRGMTSFGLYINTTAPIDIGVAYWDPSRGHVVTGVVLHINTFGQTQVNSFRTSTTQVNGNRYAIVIGMTAGSITSTGTVSYVGF
jgi:hypothetical protein